MMLIVLDTNVFISGMFWKGKEHDVLQLCIDEVHQNITSPVLVDELKRVLGYKKFDLKWNDIDDMLQIYISFSKIIHPDVVINAVEGDPSDDRFIECAVSGDAKIIITGDKHLLDIQQYDNIEIIKPADFLKIVVE